MKRLFSFRLSIAALGSLLLIAMLFSACKKFNDNDIPETPVAGVMAFNLAPDVSSANIAFSGNLLTGSPLSYNSYTGTYLRVYPGARPVESFDYNSGRSLAAGTFTFESDKYYSLFVVGTDSSYRNVIVNDNFDSLTASSGQAFVRYINAIPDSSRPTVTIASNGTSIVNENAAFASVSEFQAISAGQVSIAVSNGETINATRTIALEQGRVYTVLLSGIPGSTGADKVEIKFIQNGTLDETAGRASSAVARAVN